VPLPDRTLERGGPIDAVVGDKGLSRDRLREQCLQRDMTPKATLKANREPDLWVFYAAGYRERNRVERLFGKAKQF
jgi:hypothetical protein